MIAIIPPATQYTPCHTHVTNCAFPRVEKWPVGALVAQACHASTAVLHLYRDDPNVGAYLGDVDRMHKVVLEVRLRVTLCLYCVVVQL